MSDIPEIEIDPTVGPILKLKNSNGTQSKKLDLDDNGDLAVGGSAIKGKLLDYNEVKAESKTTTNGWSLKATMSPTVSEGEYLILISFNYSAFISFNNKFEAKIEIDGNEVWSMSQRANSATDINPVSKTISVTLNNTNPLIELYYGPSNKNKSASISDVVIAIWRK